MLSHANDIPAQHNLCIAGYRVILTTTIYRKHGKTSFIQESSWALSYSYLGSKCFGRNHVRAARTMRTSQPYKICSKMRQGKSVKQTDVDMTKIYGAK